MLPKRMEELRLKEISARDGNAANYDNERQSDYTLLLDHHSIGAWRLTGSERVLDLACGTGRTTVKLASLARELVAVDFSLASLKVAKAKYQRSGSPARVWFIQADANALPFGPTGLFDFINALDFIQHVPGFTAREAILRDLRSFLKPGGELALTAYHYSDRKRAGDPIRTEPGPGEGGKQGLHRGGFYYYNFQLEEALCMVANAGFRIQAYGVFFCSPPRLYRLFRKIFRMDRIRFETVFQKRLRGCGERLYIRAST
ncbi:MAG: class I SAM-dependent methyltransferase [Fibrobacteres bacterium]|nr:class I SAM-dependent methyltransferase [Fibrobacterota bacterium]